MNQIQKTIEIVGGATKLAEILSVSKQFISQLSDGKRDVPYAHCVAIEFATNGEVSRKDLRPDDWEKIWPELKAA